MWGYKMTQFLLWAYDWVGLPPKTSQDLPITTLSLAPPRWSQSYRWMDGGENRGLHHGWTKGVYVD